MSCGARKKVDAWEESLAQEIADKQRKLAVYRQQQAAAVLPATPPPWTRPKALRVANASVVPPLLQQQQQHSRSWVDVVEQKRRRKNVKETEATAPKVPIVVAAVSTETAVKMELEELISMKTIQGPSVELLWQKLEAPIEKPNAPDLQSALIAKAAECQAAQSDVADTMSLSKELQSMAQQRLQKVSEELKHAQAASDGKEAKNAPITFADADQQRADLFKLHDTWKAKVLAKQESLASELWHINQAAESAISSIRDQQQSIKSRYTSYAAAWDAINQRVSEGQAARLLAMEAKCEALMITKPTPPVEPSADATMGSNPSAATQIAELQDMVKSLQLQLQQALPQQQHQQQQQQTGYAAPSVGLKEAQEDLMQTQQTLLTPLVAGMCEAEQEARSTLREFHKEAAEEEGKGAGKGFGVHY